jgi:hypothetical protein
MPTVRTSPKSVSKKRALLVASWNEPTLGGRPMTSRYTSDAPASAGRTKWNPCPRSRFSMLIGGVSL